MWGYGLLLTMVVVAREELYGKYHTKDTTAFFLAYGGYVAVPVFIMLRVASTPVFPMSVDSSKQDDKKKLE